MTWPFRGSTRPWIYGHRGVRDTAPENTMPAFELALQRGADGIEFDVQVSCDGQAVVFHDATLERMTSGRDCRSVSGLSERELCSIRLEGGALVPRLQDVLYWANGNALYLNIELKCTGHEIATLLTAVEREISAIAARSLQERIVISSFSRDAISLVNTRGWPWKSAQLFDRDEPIEMVQVASIGSHPHFSSVRNTIDQSADRSGFVNVWTVNDADTARRLNALGVDGIITDEIALVFEALNG